MNPFSGPLPIAPAPRSPDLVGWWRAYVERLDPLAVSVPALTGPGSVCPGTVEIVPGVTVAQGDRVWVACIDGVRTQLLITAKREGS